MKFYKDIFIHAPNKIEIQIIRFILIWILGIFLSACTMQVGLSDIPLPSLVDAPGNNTVDFKGIYVLKVKESLNIASLMTDSGEYTYTIYMGAGNVDASGIYTAPDSTSFSVIKVQKSTGDYFFINVVITEELTISPKEKTLTAGSIHPFSVIGGTAPYSWAVRSGDGSIDKDTGLFTAPMAAGVVVIEVVDSHGVKTAANITVNAALKISPTAKTLGMGKNLQFTRTGGVGEVKYDLLAGEGTLNAATGDFMSPMIVGTSIVRAMDEVRNMDVAVVTTSNPLLLNVSDISLAKNTNFNFSASGGTPPYTYSVSDISNGVVLATTGLYTAPGIVGLYKVRVQDSSAPPQTTEAAVRVTDNLNFSITNISLQVGESLDLATSISGGIPAYDLDVSAGQGTVSGLIYTAPMAPGIYELTVQDSQAPTANTAKAFVTVSPALSISPATKTLAAENEFTFAASGGIPPYTFSASTGLIESATGKFVAPQSAGTVQVQVVDSKGHTANATVNVNAALEITPVSLNLNFSESSTFAATGGVPPLSFSVISGLGTINSSTGVYTAPASTSGTATIEVRDILNNVATATVQILRPLQISPSTFSMQKSTSLVFSALGGVAPYSYQIQSGSGTIGSDGKFEAGGSSGSSVVKVTDSIGQYATATVFIYDSLAISPLGVQVVVSGTKQFSATGGVGPYSFEVMPTAGGSITSAGLFTASTTPGTYTVKVLDAAGGSSETTVFVRPSLSLTPSTKSLSIQDSFAFSVSGGISPYSYSVIESNGGSVSSVGNYTAPSSPGTYTVKVIDADNNTVTSTVTVNGALSLSAAKYRVKVNQTLSFTASGGVSPYTYSVLEPNQGSINGSGVYTAPANTNSGMTATIQATDSLGHSAQKTVTLYSNLNITPLTKTLAVGNSTSFSGQGGYPPYTYSVGGGGHGTVLASGLYTAPMVPGTYTVSVNDGDGNSESATVTVAASLQISPTTATIYKGQTQNFNASGGVSPYTYSVVSGSGNINATTGAYEASGSPGTVVIRVADSLGNTSEATLTVQAVMVLTMSAAKYRLKVGQTLSFTASGGIGPYTYSVLEPGQGSINGSGVYAAPANTNLGTTATIQVMDSLGTSAQKTVTLYLDLSITPLTKTLAAGNSTSFSGQGGYPPYTYSVGGGGHGTVLANGLYTAPMVAGIYTVSVNDDDGNSASATVTVQASLQISPTTATIYKGQTQNFSASGGVSPYTYSVVSGGGNINATTGAYDANGSPGTVVIRVSDSLGDTSEATLTVQAVTLTMTAPMAGSYINNGNKASVTVSGACSVNGVAVSVTATGSLSSSVNCSGGSYTTTLNFTSVADGAIVISASHTGATDVTRNLTKDTVAPTVAITSPTSGIYVAGGTQTVSGTCSEETVVSLSAAGGSVTASPTCSSGTFTANLNLSSLSDGSYTVTATHSDLAGNAAAPSTITLNKDSAPPTAPSNVIDGQWMNSLSQSPVITFTGGTDAGGGVQKHQVQVVRVSDSSVVKIWGDFISGNSIAGLSLLDGIQYKVQIRAIDNAGNMSSVLESDGWTVDVTLPSVPTGVSLATSVAEPTRTPTVAWTSASDSGSGVSYYQVQIYNDGDGSEVGSPAMLASGNKLTGLSLTDGGLYKLAVRAVDAAGNVGNYSSFTSAWTANSNLCPSNYILVPALAGYATEDFCVAKYEMKNVSSVATSQPLLGPWVSINRDNAIIQCANLGAKYSLISNAQWQAIARNIENVGSNWSGGSVGSGFLGNGHNDNSPASALAADPDDNIACKGTGQTCDASTWNAERRTHVLSNGKVIWDFSGNVSEWVRDNYADLGVSPAISAAWREINPLSATNSALFSSENPTWDQSQSIGKIYGGSGGAIYRGGYWASTGEAGVFMTKMDTAPSFSSIGIGFRCVYIP